MNTQQQNGNKSEQSKATVWDDGTLDEVEYVKFDDGKNNTVRIKFLENNPTAGLNKFGSKSFDFEAMDLDGKTVKCFSITSKRLMRHLSEYRPLEGKSFCIQRTGEDMDVDYNVVLEAEQKIQA